jgi:3-oxoacyl-[acyl-carrier protein] reductase
MSIFPRHIWFICRSDRSEDWQCGSVDSAGMLRGRVALVTGVSRRSGIGFAIARRLLADGASVYCHSWSPHDEEQPWGADPIGVERVVATLNAPADRIFHESLDLAVSTNASRLVTHTAEHFGHVDFLIANHARSSGQSLVSVTVEELDASWAVNARASVLLVQAFAAQHDDTRSGGRVVLFTSGQHREPMSAELPYAISKGAVHQMTLTLSEALAGRGITVNAIDPGPTDTGWATPEVVAQAAASPSGRRWSTPDQIATLVRSLIDEDADTITGHVIEPDGDVNLLTR